MLTFPGKAKRWAIERTTEILVLSIWAYFFSRTFYDSREGFSGFNLIWAIIGFEITSFFFVTSFFVWLITAERRWVRPFVIAALSFIHLVLLSDFPSGGRIDTFMWVGVLIVFLNSLAHSIFKASPRAEHS